MMNKTQEALKMAIHQMKAYAFKHLCDYQCEDKELLEVISKCEETLAEEALNKMAENARELELDYDKQETQEPVAWKVISYSGTASAPYITEQKPFVQNAKVIPLYTHPLKRLTDDEIEDIGIKYSMHKDGDFFAFATAIMDKLGVK